MIGFKRRNLFLLASFCLNVIPLRYVHSASKALPSTKSIQNDIVTAVKVSKPLIVLVSLDNCPFCKIARENYLIPLISEQALPVIQVNLGHTTPIFDAQGRLTTQAALIQSWKVVAAPTVLFLGKNGVELVPRLVGGTSSDFYGAYLQERIDAAMKTL
jgi:thioredoxin-related protein